MKKISKIHGLALSAWAIAGITGNNMSELILSSFNNKYDYILIFTAILYTLALLTSIFIVRKKQN